MLSIFLGIICIVLLIFLLVVCLKLKPLNRELKNLKAVSAGAVISNKNMVDDFINGSQSDLQNNKKPTHKILDDPLAQDLSDVINSRVSFFYATITKLLEGSQIVLGITAGLFGMSVVAIIFHFMKNVVYVETSQFFESVSYSVFFFFVMLGIISNGYLHRKIRREQDKLLQAELSYQEQLESLKSSYQVILQESERNKNDIISAEGKIADQLGKVLADRQNIISKLKNRSAKKLFPKLGRKFRR